GGHSEFINLRPGADSEVGMSGSLVRLPGTRRFIARLQADGADTAFTDVASQRALMVLSGVYLSLAGALLTIVWLALPYHPSAADETGLWLMALGSGSLGAMLLIGGDRLPPWGFQVFAIGS